MKTKKYTSVLAPEIEGFIKLRRSLGYKVEAMESRLHTFDLFLVDNQVSDKVITRELCMKWCLKRSHETIRTQQRRIEALRAFCGYLSDLGLKAYSPPIGLVKKAPRYIPHIYTDDELKKFFAAVDQSKSLCICPYRTVVMPVFFRILYTSGLRVSELRLAKVGDFDLEKGILTVRQAKNHKDRLVPVHPKLVAKCRKILEIVHPSPNPEEFFFLVRPNTPMSLSNVYLNFRRYLEKAGISHTGRGPRVHDFRHTYCVNLLRKWTEEGRDLMAWLPYLRTMLGHETFQETAYYLRLTEQMFPTIKEQLAKNLPDIFKELLDEEPEFY